MKKHLTAYAVRQSENGKSYWTRIGPAFAIKGNGAAVILDALPAPADGKYKIVLFPPKEKPDATSTVVSFE
ncbi:MAG: hypothetical protein JST30_07700 [Armatimonadetes bacterium]|nr:hypothetical protein [Armatimonadota bacterium]